MDYLKKIAAGNADKEALKKVLDESLGIEDAYCKKSRDKLASMGVEKEDALTALACHKSSVKYGYELSSKTPLHILRLTKDGKEAAPLKRLVESPFFLVKASWLYEHSPFFFFFEEDKAEERDYQIIKFAKEYENRFINNHVAIDAWKTLKNPRRVRTTTFWESHDFDPVLMIEKAKKRNIEGVEFSFDFHPFNETTLLPEELSPEKREHIREASLRSGVKIDIHSPIVGPYTPSPDPSKGRQRFFDPTQCLDVQYDTIRLAKEIGAGCVVFHLIDSANLKLMVALVEKAGGSDVRITIENYCQTRELQTADVFIEWTNEILNSLSGELREKNFGITLDVGHLNIEGDDPLIASEKIANWCLENDLFLRLHATDNYGNLLFSAPAYSADVHSNVTGRGINNSLIIEMLRSKGLKFNVVAEQIQPLTSEDISIIHEAQTSRIAEPYETYVKTGQDKLSSLELEEFMSPEAAREKAYHFLAGFKGINALKEYLVYRKIQDKKYLSVDEAKRISRDFMKMPQKLKSDLTNYIDDLLLPIQSETGSIQKSELDLICQNISGALFETVSNEHLNHIFSHDTVYHKGDIICEQNGPGQKMYFIKEGEVTVAIEKSLMATLGPGEIFGEMSLFYNINRSATIKAAKEKTKVGVLTRKGLEKLFRSGEPYASDLIHRLYNILPDRLRNLNDKYKTAIRTLHLVFTDSDSRIPDIDRMLFDFNREKAHFFPTLSQAEAQEIYKEVKDFDANTTVFSEGDQGEGAYYIMEGKVKVVGLSPSDKEILLGELDKGEIFGEMALIDDKPRSASIITLTPCKLAFIDKKKFTRLAEDRSELGLRLMGFVCLSLFRRILRLDELYSEIKKKIRGS